MKSKDKNSDGCLMLGCLLPFSGLLFAFMAPGVGISILLPLLKLTGGSLHEQEVQLAATVYVYGFGALCAFEARRLFFGSKTPAPEGFEEFEGSFEEDWAGRLLEAGGALLDAASPEEQKANQGCNQGCLTAFLFAGICSAIVPAANPENFGEFVLLLLLALVGLILWGRFFRSVHRVQALEQWLVFDFLERSVTWVERRRGKRALANEPLAAPRLVLKNDSFGTRLLLCDGPGREFALTSASKPKDVALSRFASGLSERSGVPLEDLRQD